jgi:hypothetical protein
MISKQVILTGIAAIVLGVGAAHAGPCNTGGKDAGSGPTPGYTGQTTTGTGSAKTDQHPPTETMNRVAGEKATSSQDAQRQQQGEPTAAQQAQGAKPSTKMADQGC